jgi:hypothetical protein
LGVWRLRIGTFLMRRSSSPVYGMVTAYLKDLYGMRKGAVSRRKKLQGAERLRLRQPVMRNGRAGALRDGGKTVCRYDGWRVCRVRHSAGAGHCVDTSAARLNLIGLRSCYERGERGRPDVIERQDTRATSLSGSEAPQRISRHVSPARANIEG